MKKLIIGILALVAGTAFSQEKKKIDSAALMKELEAVAVTGKKELIERKVDRLVFNVENSAAAQGTDLTDALKHTPMLRVDEQKGISIAGKSGVAVMINDKILNLSGEELTNYLKSLRTDNVARIEVITTPPAKYEAQGNGGLINIVLKKNPNLGFSGNLSTALNQTRYTGTANNLNLNYQTEKLSLSLKLRHTDRAKRSTENLTFQNDTPILSRDVRKDMYRAPGANFSADYKISKKSALGLVYDIGQSDTNLDIVNNSGYYTGQRLDSLLVTHTAQRNRTVSQTLSGYFDHNFNDEGRKMSLAANYFSNHPKYRVDFNTAKMPDTEADYVRNLSDIRYSIWSAQADFTLPYTFGKIEAGAKYTDFKNDSDVRYQNLVAGAYIQDGSRSNLFRYAEKNYAAYGSFSKDFSERWAVQAGLRYEYSVVNGYSPATNDGHSSHYGRLFPTAYLNYKPDDRHAYSLNYSRRINRPGFRALNPFRWYSNPYTYYSGNPDVQPSYSDNLELGFIYKGNFSATAYWQHISNGSTQVVLEEGHLRRSTFLNCFNLNSVGFNTSYTLKPVQFWEANLSTDFHYSKTKNTSPEVQAVQLPGVSFYYEADNTVTLNKPKTLFLLVNWWHILPSRENNVVFGHRSELDIGIKAGFIEKKLQMSLTANDIFRTARSIGHMEYAAYRMDFNNYYSGQNILLSATYNFGNGRIKGTSRNIRFDEKNRAN